jgi:hypothetical protein
MPELLQKILSANGAIAYYRAHPASMPDAGKVSCTAPSEDVRCE